MSSSITLERTSTQTAEPRARPSDPAIAFLQSFDATGRHNLVAIHPNGDVHGRTFEPGDWDGMARWIDERHLTHNLYFSHNEPRADAPHNKLSKADIAFIRSISVDLDPDGEGDFETQRAAVRQRLRKAVKEDGLPQPTMVVDSGNGLQAHWVLKEKVSAERMKEWAENQARAFARRLDGDSTQNIDRLLRLPGLTNFPNAKKRETGRVERPTRVVAQIPARFKVVELSDAVPPEPKAIAPDEADLDRRCRELEDEIESSDWDTHQSPDDWEPELRSKIERLKADVPAFDDLWEGRMKPGDGSGSAYRLRAAALMGRHGTFGAVEFASVMHAWPLAHGTNALTARLAGRDWARIGEPEQKRQQELLSMAQEEPGGVDPPLSSVAPAAPQPTAKLRPTPYAFPEPRTIPPRQWLYPPHLIRKYLSATVAPGGVGKSSLLVTEMLAMASGKPLLGVKPTGQFRCWLFNAEDPRQEIDMRIAAAMQHHGLTREDLEGRVFTDSGRDTPLVIAKSGRDGATVLQPVADNLVAVMRERGIDVMQVDPFVSTHRVAESNNDDMDLVAKEWSRIADRADAAIDLVHHTRKTGGAEVTVEDSRGATALINAARSARVLVRMTAPEAAKLGIANHRRYLRIGGDPKNNLAPPASDDKTTWFELVSVNLMNGGGDAADAFVSGDSVGVVSLADLGAQVEVEETDKIAAAIAAIAAGTWRADVRAGNWVGRAIAAPLGLDADDKADRAKINAVLASLKRTHRVHEVQRLDESRHQRLFVEVRKETSTAGSVFE